jgi:hypothetical protein
MKTTISLIILFFILSGSSCSKNKDKTDTTPPVITINNPLNGQTFTNGQTIPISGTVTDNVYIAEVHIHVTNINTGVLLMDAHIFPATATITFNQSITAASGIHYKIQVVATDREVNEGRSIVTVSCN